jgi:hypothetical protein
MKIIFISAIFFFSATSQADVLDQFINEQSVKLCSKVTDVAINVVEIKKQGISREVAQTVLNQSVPKADNPISKAGKSLMAKVVDDVYADTYEENSFTHECVSKLNKVARQMVSSL